MTYKDMGDSPMFSLYILVKQNIFQSSKNLFMADEDLVQVGLQ